MAVRTWIGGGNNNARNPKHWSPSGPLQPGDVLTISAGTIEVHGDQLADIGGLTILGDASLDMTNATVGTITVSSSPFVPLHPEINLKGTDTFDLDVKASGIVTVDLAQHSQWVGGFHTLGGPLSPFSDAVVINGQAGATFINTGSFVAPGPKDVVNADIAGTGSFAFGIAGWLEVGKSVGPGQIIDMSGDTSFARGSIHLTIDEPNEFEGVVQGLRASSKIDLTGLAGADSYTYQNDMLTLFGGGNVLDTLRLGVNPNYGMAVGKIGSDLTIYGGSPDPAATLLPVHT